MPATGRDAVVLPPQKGGTAGLARNINIETGEVHLPWGQYKTGREGPMSYKAYISSIHSMFKSFEIVRGQALI
jgi:hypothetical protein